MNHVRSVTPVNTNKGWAVCQSNDDGSELFVMAEVFETPYTMQHAKLEADALKKHLESGGKTYARPLPSGVKVVH